MKDKNKESQKIDFLDFPVGLIKGYYIN